MYLNHDATSIHKKQTVWIKKKNDTEDFGLRRLGFGGIRDTATEALVFQLVSLDDYWKHPVVIFALIKPR